MATRPSRAEQEAALSRRLEQLSAELAGVRAESPRRPPPPDVAESSTEETSPEDAVVPVPGRHAARRGGRAPDALVPPPLRGRVAVGPAQLAVVAVLVALGLGVTAWWVVRSDPRPVAPVPPMTTGADVLATPAAEASATAADGGTVTVDVTGKVRRPGIAVLDSGARVVDALKAAGGARRGVDLTGLNLARPLVDGEQILVGVEPAPVAVPSAPAATGGALVNLNTAGLEELESLPEVGPVTAQAIITWRDANGGFTSVSELLEVDGIGEATLDAMAPFVTV